MDGQRQQGIWLDQLDYDHECTAVNIDDPQLVHAKMDSDVRMPHYNSLKVCNDPIGGQSKTGTAANALVYWTMQAWCPRKC